MANHSNNSNIVTPVGNSEEQLKPKTLEDQLMEASYLLHKQEFSELYLETGEMGFLIIVKVMESPKFHELYLDTYWEAVNSTNTTVQELSQQLFRERISLYFEELFEQHEKYIEFKRSLTPQ